MLKEELTEKTAQFTKPMNISITLHCGFQGLQGILPLFPRSQELCKQMTFQPQVLHQKSLRFHGNIDPNLISIVNPTNDKDNTP